MAGPRANAEIQRQVVDLYAQGHSRRKVAEIASLTLPTVTGILKHHGVELRPHFKQVLGDDDLPTVVQLYQGGEKIPDIAALYGCTELTVRRALDRSGVERRDDRGRRRQFTEEELGVIRSLATEGEQPWKIALLLDSSLTTIKKALGEDHSPKKLGRPRGPGRALRACEACSKEFKPRHDRSRFCSLDCRDKGQRGENSLHWKGGRTIRADGYVMVRVQGHPAAQAGHDYVPEHRLVMEKMIGRYLEDHETVHHINGIRDDNREENLQLRSGRHGKGAAYQCLDCGSHNVVAVKLKESP